MNIIIKYDSINGEVVPDGEVFAWVKENVTKIEKIRNVMNYNIH